MLASKRSVEMAKRRQFKEAQHIMRMMFKYGHPIERKFLWSKLKPKKLRPNLDFYYPVGQKPIRKTFAVRKLERYLGIEMKLNK